MKNSPPKGAVNTEKTRSTGFGLFSIGERLAYMGGRMEIHSAVGQGTKITIVVPADHKEMHLAEQNSPASLSTAEPEFLKPASNINRPIRVLLADDHKIVRDGLSSLLSEQPDIEVIGQAEDGRAAVEMARSLYPDVVIMDVTMPQMDGLEATRRVKAELSSVSIIGLSMHTETDMAKAMCEAGAVAYLSKAGPTEKLVETIRSCHSHFDRHM